MSLAVILLAAGASRRMGGIDKLTQPVRGQPLLRDRAEMVLASDVASPVIVVLPPNKPARARALEGLTVHRVTNGQAASGMASSIRAGVRALPETADAALIMVADMPDLAVDDLRQMAQAHQATPQAILRATTENGAPGNPVLFPRAYFHALSGLEGEQTGRVVLQRFADSVMPVPLPGERARLDLDTPEAWAAWREANPE